MRNIPVWLHISHFVSSKDLFPRLTFTTKRRKRRRSRLRNGNEAGNRNRSRTLNSPKKSKTKSKGKSKIKSYTLRQTAHWHGPPAMLWSSIYVTSHHLVVAPQSFAKYQFLVHSPHNFKFKLQLRQCQEICGKMWKKTKLNDA